MSRAEVGLVTIAPMATVHRPLANACTSWHLLYIRILTNERKERCQQKLPANVGVLHVMGVAPAEGCRGAVLTQARSGTALGAQRECNRHWPWTVNSFKCHVCTGQCIRLRIASTNATCKEHAPSSFCTMLGHAEIVATVAVHVLGTVCCMTGGVL